MCDNNEVIGMMLSQLSEAEEEGYGPKYLVYNRGLVHYSDSQLLMYDKNSNVFHNQQ